MLNKTKPANLNGRKHKLTDRQARFAEEYATDGNGKRAAIAVGVPENTAASLACQWLTLPKYTHVKAEVDRLVEAKREECNIDGQRLIALLLEVACFNPKSIVDPKTGEPLPLHKMSSSAARAVAEFEIVVKKVPIGKKLKKGKQRFKVKRFLVPKRQWDKLRAIKQIAEMCGLVAPKRVDLGGHVGIGLDWLLTAPRTDAEVAEEMERRLNEPVLLPPLEQE